MIPWPEKWLSEHDATDGRIFSGLNRDAPIMRNTVTHSDERTDPVSFMEGLPCEIHRELLKLREKPSAHNEVVR